MGKEFQPTEHPTLPIPTPAEMQQMGAEKWLELMTLRERIIEREKADPLNYGWEPTIWRICDAIMGFDWVSEKEAERIRACLGFAAPVDQMLIMGGNRASKSEYAAKRVQQLLNRTEKALAWCFHSSNQNSVEYHHPLLWRYMPSNLKQTIRTPTTYVSYNAKYGFSDNKFVLPNESVCVFRNYEQDAAKLEGGDINVAWCDELVPPEVVESLRLRTATRAGKTIVTFTPVRGYTATVKIFQDGAEAVRESPAFLLPRDAGEEREDLALALEDCTQWLEGKSGCPAVPGGRRFETAIRVMKCFEGDRAIVFFFTPDNPYGNPAKVLERIRGRPKPYIRERWYGRANKMLSSRFPKFDLKVHGINAAEIPLAGTNYHLVDPASGRNFFMMWVRRTKEGLYVCREWPGNYEIPGYGIPGPWALPDGKKADGKMGPGQDTFGFGLLQYKAEIARLEGWQDATKPLDEKEAARPERDRIADWKEEHGVKEKIEERRMDSRFASAPKLENDRTVTLLEEFDKIHLTFVPTPGDDIWEGVALINDALDYDTDKPVDFFNKPKLFVNRDCINTIFALQNWTGADGTKGACKDPIDLLRYAFLSDLEFVEPGSQKAERGGHY